MIAIIMPVWNQLDYTKIAIESLTKTTKTGTYLLIVIDNGSDIETEKYLQEQHEKAIISVLHTEEKNVGWIKACNIGSDLAKRLDAEYVAFVNNDIVFQEEWLDKIGKRFALRPDVGAIGPISNYVAGLQDIRQNMMGLDREEVNLLIGFFFVVRMSVLNIIGPMDESFGLGGADDLDYSIRIREAGFKLLIDRTIYIHHFGSKSINQLIKDEGTTYDKYHQEKDALIIKKWGIAKFAELREVGERLRICYALPLGCDLVHRKFMRSFSLLVKPGKWDYADIPRVNIAEARNLLVQHSLSKNATHTMFIDDDMVFDSDAIMRLLDHDKDIVSGYITGRRKPYNTCLYRYNENKTALVPCNDVKNTGLQEFDAVGGAFLLVNNKVLQAMKLPYFVYGDKSLGIAEDIGGLGEDMSFCLRAKKAGFSIFADTNIIIRHLGENAEIGPDAHDQFEELGYIKFIDN